jgi:hypothetical protein
MIHRRKKPSIYLSAVLMLPLVAGTLIACDDNDDADADHEPGDHDKQDAGHKDAGHTDTDSGEGASDHDAGDSASEKLSFFVTSDTSITGSLGGLSGADARCLKLAKAVGAASKTWHAYLSVAKGPDDKSVHARDRIGKGPWYNAKGVEVAKDLDALHARSGDAEVFLDENGHKINGQWAGSPPPVEHDVLTGSTPEGMLLEGKTCADWTSSDMAVTAQVGHSDGLGPNMSSMGMYASWNSSHENGGCNDTAPRGGAGRLYCFAVE